MDANNEFSGLGSAAADSTGFEKYAFRGVIVGKTGNEVITNKTKQPLIKVSNGSVVRNFTVAVNTSAEVVLVRVAHADDQRLARRDLRQRPAPPVEEDTVPFELRKKTAVVKIGDAEHAIRPFPFLHTISSGQRIKNML